MLLASVSEAMRCDVFVYTNEYGVLDISCVNARALRISNFHLILAVEYRLHYTQIYLCLTILSFGWAIFLMLSSPLDDFGLFKNWIFLWHGEKTEKTAILSDMVCCCYIHSSVDDGSIRGLFIKWDALNLLIHWAVERTSVTWNALRKKNVENFPFGRSKHLEWYSYRILWIIIIVYTTKFKNISLPSLKSMFKITNSNSEGA